MTTAFSKRSFVVVCAFLFAALSLSSCLKPITVGKVKNFSVTNTGNQNVNLSFQVPVNNPNFFRIKIKQANIAVNSNNKTIASIKKQQNFIIKGHSNLDQKVDIELKYSDLMTCISALANLISKNKLELQLVGELKVGVCIFSKRLKIDEKTSVELFKK